MNGQSRRKQMVVLNKQLQVNIQTASLLESEKLEVQSQIPWEMTKEEKPQKM